MFKQNSQNSFLRIAAILIAVLTVLVLMFLWLNKGEKDKRPMNYTIQTDKFGRTTFLPRMTPTENGRSIQELSFAEKPKSLQIYDIANAYTDIYDDMYQDLDQRCSANDCDSEDLKGLTYLQTLSGDYSAAKKSIQQNCQKYEKGCQTNVNLIILGKVLKSDGTPLPSAKVSVISDASVQPVETDFEGKYRLTLRSNDLTRVRLQATKRGYADATIPFDTLGLPNEYTMQDVDFTLAAPVKSVILNNATRKFSGAGVTLVDNSFVVTTDRSEYRIPLDNLVKRSGEPFSGEVEAFLFEFDKSSEKEIWQLLANDTFDDVAGYAGDIMKTFGLPYIKFIAKDGETIHVRKSRPMLLTYQIPEMQALYKNEDKIYEPLEDADMDFLVEQSLKLGGFPIDRQFLIENEFLRFPAFWVFDQTKGIWENIGIKVLDHSGKTQMPFYTINDQTK